MIRLLAVLVGFVALVAGAMCTASGYASLQSLDEGDQLLSGRARFITSTTGFVGSTRELAGRSTGIRQGTITVRLRIHEGSGLFIGIAPAAAFDTYAGLARREILDRVGYDPLTARRTTLGSGERLPPPADALPWAASATGDAPLELTWQATDGEYVFAILNADGSPGVEVTIEFGTRFRHQRAFAIAGIAIGLALVGAGLAISVLALRRRRPARPRPS